MELFMETVCGRALKETNILVSGRIIKLMVMESIFGSMAISMRGSSKNFSNMGMALRNLLMGILIMEITKAASLMVTVNILGTMAVYIRVTLNRVYVMERVYGRRIPSLEIPMKVIIKMTENVAMAFSSGAQVISIKASSSMI
jgi:hypothetical protein